MLRRRLKSNTDCRSRSNAFICIINRLIIICTCILITSSSTLQGHTPGKPTCCPKLLIELKLSVTIFMLNVCCLTRWSKMILYLWNFAMLVMSNLIFLNVQIHAYSIRLIIKCDEILIWAVVLPGVFRTVAQILKRGGLSI